MTFSRHKASGYGYCGHPHCARITFVRCDACGLLRCERHREHECDGRYLSDSGGRATQ